MAYLYCRLLVQTGSHVSDRAQVARQVSCACSSCNETNTRKLNIDTCWCISLRSCACIICHVNLGPWQLHKTKDKNNPRLTLDAITELYNYHKTFNMFLWTARDEQHSHAEVAAADDEDNAADEENDAARRDHHILWNKKAHPSARVTHWWFWSPAICRITLPYMLFI